MDIVSNIKNGKVLKWNVANGATEALMRAVGTDWSELDETVKTSIAKAVQDRFKPY